jgi:hypothetical protein
MTQLTNTPAETFVEKYGEHEHISNDMELTSKDIAKLYELLGAYRETIRTVLREAVESKRNGDYQEGVEPAEIYNEAIDDILTLIDSTLSANTDNHG